MLWMLIAAGAVLLGGGYAIARMTRQPEGVKRLLEAQRVAIADAGDATDVRIEGTVEALGETVTSPLTMTKCVYFEHVVEEVGDSGALGGSVAMVGIPVHRAVECVAFIVRDASGYAIVDPTGATALLRVDHEAGDRASTAGVAFRRWMGVPGAGKYHAEKEKLLVPGDRVVVIGRGVREPDPDASTTTGTYRDGPATRLRLMHSAQFPLHLLEPG